MAKLKKLNVFRRKLMRLLTRNVGPSKTYIKGDSEIAINRILINRPNGRLGNLLLITPLVKEVSETFPNSKIDLFVKGNLAPILFENYENVDHYIILPGKPFKNLFQYAGTWIRLKKNSYDLVFNVIPTSSSGRLSTKVARSKNKSFGDLPQTFKDQYDDYAHIAKYPVYSFRKYLNFLGLETKDKPVYALDLNMNPSEIEVGKRILDDLVKNDKKAICIFTYATGEKRLTEVWWTEMYEKLQSTFPDYNIVEVLPKENVSQIAFKAPTYYSREIREIGAFIHNSAVFIGADSGMMHLASAAGTPTVGLFSITNHEVYAPYNGNSIAINTNSCTTEECVLKIKNVLDQA